MTQSKEENKSLPTNPKEVDICELPDKELKIIREAHWVTREYDRELNEIRKAIFEQNKNINQERG